MWRLHTARNPPPLPLPKSPKDLDRLSTSNLSLESSPTKYARHSRTESMKLDQLFFQRQKGHSPSASMSRLSSSASTITPTSMASPAIPQTSSYTASPQHDLGSMADQLNTISTTTTTVLTTLQTLMRRSKDNATELDNLRKQVVESKERDTQTVDEIKRLLSSSNSTTDLTALYAKLDSLRPTPPVAPPAPAPVPSAHKLEEEKAAIESILTNANQALAHLLTLTESINNLTSHLNNATTRLKSEESELEILQSKKSTLETELARLEASIHLRNLELTSFTQKAEVLESRILRAKTAVQLSGSKTVKMKKSPLIQGPGGPAGRPVSRGPNSGVMGTITPQRRILSMSSTNNVGSPARSEHPGPRKTSWSKKIGGMLSGLTNSNNKENTGDVVRGKTYVLGDTAEKEVLGLGVPAVSRGRSVSERTK